MKLIKKIINRLLGLIFKPRKLPGVSYTFNEETWLGHGIWKTGLIDRLRTSDITYPLKRIHREQWKTRTVVRAYPPPSSEKIFGIIH
jgi:hypothetical protein